MGAWKKLIEDKKLRAKLGHCFPGPIPEKRAKPILDEEAVICVEQNIIGCVKSDTDLYGGAN